MFGFEDKKIDQNYFFSSFKIKIFTFHEVEVTAFILKFYKIKRSSPYLFFIFSISEMHGDELKLIATHSLRI